MSGEPMVPEIDTVFPGGKLQAALPLPEYEKAVIRTKDYRNRYNWYWTASAAKTHSGKWEKELGEGGGGLGSGRIFILEGMKP